MIEDMGFCMTNNMKLNRRKKEELERLAFFNNHKVEDFSDEEIEKYFLYSERGIGNGGRLAVCKERVGICLGMWEESFLAMDGSWLGYKNLVKGMPRHVVNFIKKEMFSGADAEIIENCYENH